MAGDASDLSGPAESFLLTSQPDSASAALQKIAGYKGQGRPFRLAVRLLTNLRDAILALCPSIGSIGLVVGGALYTFGSPHAGRTLFGVVIGVGLVMLGAWVARFSLRAKAAFRHGC